MARFELGETLFTTDEIAVRVRDLARQISRDYEGEEILACETVGITVTLPKPVNCWIVPWLESNTTLVSVTMPLVLIVPAPVSWAGEA